MLLNKSEWFSMEICDGWMWYALDVNDVSCKQYSYILLRYAVRCFVTLA